VRRAYRSSKWKDCTGITRSTFALGALRLTWWTAVVVLVSVEVLAVSADRERLDAVQLTLSVALDAATLTHFLLQVIRQCSVAPSPPCRHQHVRQQELHQLPARLTSVTRAHHQLVGLYVLRLLTL